MAVEERDLEKDYSFFADTDRRKFLKYLSSIPVTYSFDTAVNIMRQLSIDEFSPLEPQEEFHYEGAKALIENREPELNVYVFGESLGEVQNNLAYKEVLENHARELPEARDIEADLSFIDNEDIENRIEGTGVKQLDNEGSVLMDDIEAYLEGFEGAESSDFNIVIGDFETSLGDYKGSYVGGSYGAVSNVNSDYYVLNQILHQFAHMLGAPQSAFMSAGDQMSWSPLKEARARFDIVPFGMETEQKVSEKLERAYEDIHTEE